MTFTDTVLGRGCYTIPEAAQYAGISSAKARRWLSGRPFTPDYPRLDGQVSISFLNLVELAVGAAIVRGGGRISPAYRLAISDPAPLVKPFARREFVATFPGLEWLHAQLEYEASGLARLWHIRPGVILSPHHHFGGPICEHSYISARVLAGPVLAGNDTAENQAWAYGVPVECVERCVEFEGWLAGR